VHDSDGLLMATGNGEWIWRPLNNPLRLRISAYQDNNPRGFGLLQRDRDFDNYQDLEAHYHSRPGIWVEPQGDWGKGSVQLIEIPSNAERYDNIAAFWNPEKPVEAGQQLEFNYRLSFFLDMPNLIAGRSNPGQPGRRGRRRRPQSRDPAVRDRFRRRGPGQAGGKRAGPGVVSASTGQIQNVVAHKNPTPTAGACPSSCCRRAAIRRNCAAS
jgi:glucans biosynthesis protein